jgi:FAD/FMN-containing dehydrogenase
MRLYVLAHTDKARAYAEYADHYLRTDGQLYWSDEHQFSPYLPEAGRLLYQRMGWTTFASLMISELYVPRSRFVEFMTAVRRSVRDTGANVVYGTVRLIETESETHLRWAKDDYACIIFNLLVEHSPYGIAQGEKQFQGLIDCALDEGGSYYLTYHRWARKDQVERAYPEFREFLALKDQYDPSGVFTSEWHRHYRRMFG